MSYETELAIAQFRVASELAAHGVVADQCDANLCEDNRTISAHTYAGERYFVASIELPQPIDPGRFDRHEWGQRFLAGIVDAAAGADRLN